MKKAVLFLTSVFASFSLLASAQATPPHEIGADTLLKATYQPGFEANPKRRIFVLKADGKMSLEVLDQRGGGTATMKDLGQLSASAVENLKKDINAIPADAKLVDARAGEPPCMDTPTITVSVRSNNKVMEVYRRANCHSWDISSYQGRLAGDFGALFLRFE